MDAATFEMVLTAYDETSQDARAQGHPDGVAHKEGLTAAAMCLAAMTGVEDAAAMAEVERLDLAKQLAA
jgi:hypothetical protein